MQPHMHAVGYKAPLRCGAITAGYFRTSSYPLTASLVISMTFDKAGSEEELLPPKYGSSGHYSLDFITPEYRTIGGGVE